MQAGSTTGALTGSLLGLGAQTGTNVVAEGSWPYGSLPDPFPTASYATTAAPLVFMTPF